MSDRGETDKNLPISKPINAIHKLSIYFELIWPSQKKAIKKEGGSNMKSLY